MCNERKRCQWWRQRQQATSASDYLSSCKRFFSFNAFAFSFLFFFISFQIKCSLFNDVFFCSISQNAQKYPIWRYKSILLRAILSHLYLSNRTKRVERKQWHNNNVISNLKQLTVNSMCNKLFKWTILNMRAKVEKNKIIEFVSRPRTRMRMRMRTWMK